MLTQAQLQQILDQNAWTNKEVELLEPVTLTGPQPLQINGCFLKGWVPVNTAHPQVGVRGMVKVTNRVTSAIKIKGPGAGVIGLTIEYPEQGSAGTVVSHAELMSYKTKQIPLPESTQDVFRYKPTILGEGPVVVKDCTFVGAWDMVDLYNAGQCILDNIWGQVRNISIRMRDGRDVSKLSNIHLWPNSDIGAIKDAYWPRGNGRGIVLMGMDWVDIQNAFIFGAHVGVQISQSGGVGTGLQCGLLQCDAVNVPLDVYAPADTVMVSMLKVAGNTYYGGEPTTGIIARGQSPGTVMIGQYHMHGNIANPYIIDGGKLKISQMVRENF